MSLDSIHGCLAELEACSKGLAQLDHLFNQAVNDLEEAEGVWENIEARAAEDVRKALPSAATATEVKAAITRYVNDRPHDAAVREDLRAARHTKEKVERFMRSLEKRMSAAQSAANGHEALGRYGGGG